MVSGFPFIIQEIILLISSRESIILNNKWNQRILRCVSLYFFSLKWPENYIEMAWHFENNYGDKGVERRKLLTQREKINRIHTCTQLNLQYAHGNGAGNQSPSTIAVKRFFFFIFMPLSLPLSMEIGCHVFSLIYI